MSAEPKHDVHFKVGLCFIGVCVLIAFTIGAMVPWITDRIGLLHLAEKNHSVHHIDGAAALLYGSICAVFGLATGVFLSVNGRLWIFALALGLLPCGAFGGWAASLTPNPYSHAANALSFICIPLLITGACVALRRFVWRRYQKPVIASSDHAS